MEIIFQTLLVFVLFSNLLTNDNCLVAASEDAKPDKVLELTSDNYDTETGRFHIVVLNFYADWCPYSARWKPVFRETATMIYNETQQYEANTIVFGQINCEIQTTLAKRFRITKFPTTKLTVNGKTWKSEYRGARTSPAFKEYISKFLVDPIVYVTKPAEIASKIDDEKATVLMYSARNDESDDKHTESPELQVFRRVAAAYREDCKFVYVTKSASDNKVTPPDLYMITFKPDHADLSHELVYRSSASDLPALTLWAKERCLPLVREITFQNAEELTEPGLPFVLLFYDPNDKTWIEVYKRIVEKELSAEANGVVFLYANGHSFSHPLKHLGKTIKDLPVVAIDSFRHLFLYKHPIGTITQPGYLKQFIADLHSGKLDREFHFGPDPVAPESQTSHPESAFNKLGPSAYRYSFKKHDEL